MINVTGKKQNKTSLLALKHRCNVFDMILLNSQSGHKQKTFTQVGEFFSPNGL